MKSAVAAAHLAVGAHQPALLGGALELLELARVEMEEAQRKPLRVDHELAAWTEGDFGALDARLHEHGTAREGVLRRGESSLVFVAQRQVQDKIEARAQAQLFELARGLHPLCRMASISTSAPRGRPATPTAARAGYGSRTYCAMISLTRAKCARSVR